MPETYKRGHLIQFGYYDQHLQSLPAEQTVLRAVWPHGDPNATEQQHAQPLGPLRADRQSG